MAVSASASVVLLMGFVCLLSMTKESAGFGSGPMESCMTESGATRKALVDFMQGENDSKEVKCFFKCMMMTTGKMNSDGTYNMQAMEKMQTPGLYKVASTTCADFESSDLCEKAYAHIACLRDHAKEEFGKAMDM